MAKLPFLARLNKQNHSIASPAEVAEIFLAPLSHFLNPINLHFIPRLYFGKEYKDPVFSYQHHEIWGATGRILMDLLEVWKVGAEI